jgi:hypothetical protein
MATESWQNAEIFARFYTRDCMLFPVWQPWRFGADLSPVINQAKSE